MLGIDTLILEEDRFYLGRETYYDKDLESLSKKLVGTLKVIIQGESLLIKKVNAIEKTEKEIINNLDIGELIEDKDTLLHYEYIKKEKIVLLYSVKQGKRVFAVAKNSSKLVVDPIQFIWVSTIRKKYNNFKNYCLICEINKNFYITKVENYLITNANVYTKMNFLTSLDRLIEFEDLNDVLIDVKDNEIIEKCKKSIKTIYYVKLQEENDGQWIRFKKLYSHRLSKYLKK